MSEKEENPQNNESHYKLQTMQVHLPRMEPQKRPVGDRVDDAKERQLIFDPKKAQLEASRCAGCSTPFCSQGISEVQSGCPLGHNIKDFNDAIAENDIEEAVNIIYSSSQLPGSISAVCPKSLCQAPCTMRTSRTGSVNIPPLESFAVEWGFSNDKIPKIIAEDPSLSKVKIAIIGSGPAGLGAAAIAAGYGYSSTIFERSSKPGGLLQYGIPAQKLEKFRVARDIKRLTDTGLVDIQTNTSIGTPKPENDLSILGYKYKPFAELVKEYDAIIIATGAYRPKDTRVKGDAKDMVIPSLDFLTAYTKHLEGDLDITGYQGGWLNMKDKDVVVIGGGDTMVDCVTYANSQKAKSIQTLYYKGLTQMNAYHTEKDLKHVIEEMRVQNPLNLVREFTLAKEINHRDNKLAITVVDTDNRGKEIPNSDRVIIADACIGAVGFDPEHPETIFDVQGFKLDDAGKLIHHPITSPDRKGHVKGAGFVGVAKTFNGQSHSSLVFTAGDIAGTYLAAEGANAGQRVMHVANDALSDPESLQKKYGVEAFDTLVVR